MATPKSISTIKSFRILRAFRRRGEALSNAQLGRRAGLPASSVRRLLLTLTAIGAVERAGANRYRLGPLLLSLSHQVHVRDCLLQAAGEDLSRLSRQLGLPASLGVLDDHMLTYVAVAGRPAAAAPGAQYEAYSSAIGRVLLAALPKAQLDRFLHAGDLVALTPFTVTDAQTLRAELEKIRRRGYAVESEETRLGTACVAVPIADDFGRVHAAMSVSAVACSLTPARVEILSDALSAAASVMRRRLFPAFQGFAAVTSSRGPSMPPPAEAAEASLPAGMT